MYGELTGTEINQVVILVVTEDGTVQEFIKDKNEYLPLLEEAIDKWNEENEKVDEVPCCYWRSCVVE